MTEKAPVFTGIHHLKLPVSDLGTSLEWFRQAFGADRVEKFDHHDEHGVEQLVELRLAPEAAQAVAGYDPVTFGVADEAALDAWIAHFDQHHIEHTGKIGGFIGKVVGVTSPDRLDLRIYTDPVGGFEQAQMDPAQADIHNPGISTATMSSFPDGRS